MAHRDNIENNDTTILNVEAVQIVVNGYLTSHWPFGTAAARELPSWSGSCRVRTLLGTIQLAKLVSEPKQPNTADRHTCCWY